MIPAADNCNHSDVTVVQEIVHKGMQLAAPKGSNYYTKTKYMNDYSINFTEEEIGDDEERKRNVKGHFNMTNYQAN